MKIHPIQQDRKATRASQPFISAVLRDSVRDQGGALLQAACFFLRTICSLLLLLLHLPMAKANLPTTGLCPARAVSLVSRDGAQGSVKLLPSPGLSVAPGLRVAVTSTVGRDPPQSPGQIRLPLTLSDTLSTSAQRKPLRTQGQGFGGDEKPRDRN